MKFVRKTRMKVQRSIKTSSVILFISGQIYSGPITFSRQQVLSQSSKVKINANTTHRKDTIQVTIPPLNFVFDAGNCLKHTGHPEILISLGIGILT